MGATSRTYSTTGIRRPGRPALPYEEAQQPHQHAGKRAMLLPEMTMTCVVPGALNASATSGGMSPSIPSNIPLASEAAGSGNTRLSSAEQCDRKP